MLEQLGGRTVENALYLLPLVNRPRVFYSKTMAAEVLQDCITLDHLSALLPYLPKEDQQLEIRKAAECTRDKEELVLWIEENCTIKAKAQTAET